MRRKYRKLSMTLMLLPAMVLVGALLSGKAEAQVDNFRTHLSGAEEVPPVATQSQGEAIFQLAPDGLSMQYRLIVANIEDVLMAHIHLAPAGSNGGIVVWLYPSGPPPVLIPGRSQGPLATGVVTAANLVGALAGQTLADLVAAMEAGNTYVNVHTSAHGGGEIRGQID